MATVVVPLRTAAASSLIPRLSSPTVRHSYKFASLHARQLSLPLWPSFSVAVSAAISLDLPSVPSILEEIWEGILKAVVPKKKTSHMKKRHRQMAGKALKDVTSLCKCPACGATKRMHYLCRNCLDRVANAMKTVSESEGAAQLITHEGQESQEHQESYAKKPGDATEAIDTKATLHVE